MRLIVVVLLALLIPATLQARPVTDLSGRVVEIPDIPVRIACLEVLCYPRMLMLGAQDKVVAMVRTAAPWMERSNPVVAAIPSFLGTPNPEEVLALRPQVAFINKSYGLTGDFLAAAGVPALIAQPGRQARSADEFIADAKAMVRLFGQVLGGESARLAEDWCAYFDKRLTMVRSRVAAIPPERRPSLYYVRGPRVINTQGRGGYTTWVGELAGARMVVNQGTWGGKGDLSTETLLAWNPDIVVVGRQYPLDVVLADPRLADLAAVRNRRVYPTPEGVFYWDGGPEQVLLLQFLAKLLYPDLFADLDLAAEVKAYYARFYRTFLTDAEVATLLQGRSPDGSRVNPMNN